MLMPKSSTLLLLCFACTHSRVVDPAHVPDRQAVHVVLFDGTQYELASPSVANQALSGDPSGCNGPSCERVAHGPIPTLQIASTTVPEVDTGRSLLLVAGAALAVGAVALAASSSSKPAPAPPPTTYPGGGGGGSCPHLYVWDGRAFRLASDTYSVSYFEAAQRTGFDALEGLAEAGGRYRLRLVDELPETEHTDVLRLRAVDHPAGASVVPDASGALVTFRAAQPPLAATDLRGADARDLVSAKDGREWQSDTAGRDRDRAEDARDGLVLEFAKPRDAKRAKLRIAARTTPWAASMMATLLAGQGTALPAWFAKMNADARARAQLTDFLVREGMLHVQVRTARGWETRGIFWAAGPELIKEEAFDLPIDDATGERLAIRLETALGFWSVDSAAVDYGPAEPLLVRDVKLRSAVTNDGRDVAQSLARADGDRYHAATGDALELTFDAPPAPAKGMTRSFVLETTGYYLPEIAPAKTADPGAMQALIDVPGAGSRLALELLVAGRKP